MIVYAGPLKLMKKKIWTETVIAIMINTCNLNKLKPSAKGKFKVLHFGRKVNIVNFNNQVIIFSKF